MGTDFEKKLKERAASTENMLNSEFRKLEESVDKALSLNRQKIRDAISCLLYTSPSPRDGLGSRMP
ncbi:MbeB family mobilization protein, partial [Acinetobacter baumannii]|uniref:MbeB family mobilization protein n=1 Tax=Acinetobacter baumannii TaxID=470 RepID=UPI002244F660